MINQESSSPYKLVNLLPVSSCCCFWARDIVSVACSIVLSTDSHNYPLLLGPTLELEIH